MFEKQVFDKLTLNYRKGGGMKKIISLVITLVLLVLISGCTQYHARGAGVGGLLGGIAGALIDSKNPWRGGIIGATLGAVAGATLTDISMKASQEAAVSGKPVEYRTADGRNVYRADPVDYNTQTKCHKIHERVWEDRKLVKDQIKEVCEGKKFERRY